jgi:hypothetical protein
MLYSIEQYAKYFHLPRSMDFVVELGVLSISLDGSRAFVRTEPTMAPITAVTVPTTIVSLLRA